MRNNIAIALLLISLLGCVNAEIKESDVEKKYSLTLIPESNDLVLTALPGDNIKFKLKVEGLSPLKNMVFYADSDFIDISGIQNKTPPYQVEITNFFIDKNSPEKRILCKVVGETIDGMFVTSNTVIVKVIDMNAPQIIKFAKEQSPVDTIISDSTFSIIVEAQDLNSGISKIELYDANNYIRTKILDVFTEKYVSRRYNIVAPQNICGIVQMVLRVYDASSQSNFSERSLLLKINGHPFDENAPEVSFVSPEQNSTANIGETINIRVKAEDDCSLVNRLHYFTSYDEQDHIVNIVNPMRVVEEVIPLIVPQTLSDGEEFSFFVWAEDTNNPVHGSKDNAIELRLVASGKDIPSVVINSPQDNINVSIGDKINISGTAISKRHQIKEITLRLGGSYTEVRNNQLSPPQATVSFRFDFTIPQTLKSGDQILIYVDAKDDSSSESIGTAGPVRLNVVAQKPIVQILSPTNNDIFYPLGTIGTSVFAQSQVSSIVSISYHLSGIEGVAVDETFTPAPPQKSISTTFNYKLPEDVPEGTLNISAEALDKENNKGISEIINVKVIDNIKPVISVKSPPYNSLVDAGSSVDIVVNVEDKNSNVAEVDANVISPYTDYRKLLINKKSDEVKFTFNIPDNLLSNQIITIQIFAFDDSTLNNKSEVIQWRLRVR
ncbi:MAG: Ig-like domain-containing protein [Myxococcota bacterium]